ncbi:MAG: nuclear transport factor 2 family protein [Candidatus Obscuribacterales bacterium]|nr:nuclear transport factor 2 family protein [Candidatus Obscuribacterales bacterium]
MGPAEILEQYEAGLNQHRFEAVESLISDRAVFWFTDGVFSGKAAIRAAFESTWQSLNNDTYWLTDLEWLVSGETVAVCLYNFHWKTEIDGKTRQGEGKGTTVLSLESTGWKVLHEHLSALSNQ